MNEQRHAETKRLDPADYPMLRDFLPAYLHQDFGEEYGSVAEAVKGFLSEASGDEILQVKEEWKLFRRSFAFRPFGEIQAALGHLGSAWVPQNEAELTEVDEVLERAET